MAGFRRGYYERYPQELEKTFRAFFSARGFEIDVEHYVDQADLSAALHSPNYVGVYIVSHEGVAGGSVAGLVAGGLYDYEGYEMSAVLNAVHPNVRALALVGCDSSTLVAHLERALVAGGTNPALKIYGFPKEVDAKEGLGKAMLASVEQITESKEQAAPNPACQPKSGFPLWFKRVCGSSGGPAARVESQGVVLATFPRCEAGETQRETGFAVDADLKVELTTGSNAFGLKPALGALEVSRPGQAPGESWSVFAKPDGTPFGDTTNVYRHAGPDPHAWEAQDYRAFFGCEL